MRSKTISFRAPFPLHDALQKLCRERDYDGLSNCMIAISILAIQDARRPTWIRHIANAPPKLQDYLIERMLSWPLDLDGMIKAIKHMEKK